MARSRTASESTNSSHGCSPSPPATSASFPVDSSASPRKTLERWVWATPERFASALALKPWRSMAAARLCAKTVPIDFGIPKVLPISLALWRLKKVAKGTCAVSVIALG
jgi:hypothetical protein